jgi:hypothetical protein
MPKAVGELKICPKCEKTKNISEFHKDTRTVDGLKIWCKTCRYEKLNKPTKYGLPRTHKDYDKAAYLDRFYGISLDIWDKLFHDQEGTCAICNEEFKDKINVDHDHITGKVRGLLCDKCNRALGQFNDDINKLKNAIKYLENSKEVCDAPGG